MSKKEMKSCPTLRDPSLPQEFPQGRSDLPLIDGVLASSCAGSEGTAVQECQLPPI